MIKEVANEVIGVVDDFKDKNGRLPVGLHEIGAPFEGINETYEYKDYIFYYEQRKDGFYWLTITFVRMRITVTILKISLGYGIVILSN